MTPADVLAHLKSAGVLIDLLDGNLKINAPAGFLTLELKAEIVAAKPEIIKLLQPLPKWGTAARPRTILGGNPRGCPFEDCDGSLTRIDALLYCSGDHWFRLENL